MLKTDAAAVYAAYAELESATEAYYAALGAFRKVYEPKNIGIDELCEHVNMCMIEIDDELDGVL